MRDLENGTVEVARRDTLEKTSEPIDGIVDHIARLLEDIQASIYQKALEFKNANTFTVDTWDEFKAQIEKGGFLMAHWDGTSETELKIKEETKATIRCIPFDAEPEAGKCVYSGKESKQRVAFARAY
jgi:prolyl-tRNA synthetase